MRDVKVCPVCQREFPAPATTCTEDGVPLVALVTEGNQRSEDLVGKIVEGRYKIERIIGKGGMGTVYACRHVVVGKVAAMKVLKVGVERSEGVLQRFVREAQTANLLKSRHIVEVSDFGQLPSGAFFVVMELLEGQDLARAMRAGLTRAQLIHVFVQVAETLQIAHEKGIVHRDLKPDNVFLVTDGNDPLFVKLLDFGIAKILHGESNGGLTETGVILGTPYYMSPEQARAEAIDHRSDIYALGVMMYRAFTGKLPFVADSTMGVLTRHITEEPQPPSLLGNVDQATERLILRCMAKRREHRFQSMREVAEALKLLPVDPVPPIREQSTVLEGPAHLRAPTGPHAQVPSGAYPQAASGAYAQAAASGPYAQVASGHYAQAAASGQYVQPSGPYAQVASGPYAQATASGQYAQPSGPYAPVAAVPQVAAYAPAAAYDSRVSNVPASGHVVPAVVGAVPQVPAIQNDGTVTALHTPGSPQPGIGGETATTRGVAATSPPNAAPRGPSTAVLIFGAVSMAAVGATAAFFLYRPAAPTNAGGATTASAQVASSAPTPSASAAPSTTAATAPATSASAAPSTTAAAEPASTGARPRTGHLPPSKPTATATAATPATKTPRDIRSPFD
jgi:serine/threonine-protein kinase